MKKKIKTTKKEDKIKLLELVLLIGVAGIISSYIYVFYMYYLVGTLSFLFYDVFIVVSGLYIFFVLRYVWKKKQKKYS
ncbi:MAG: hypothetical protein QXU98_05560 [Candidatus Parvarchaeota archaeon]